tara:strand:+ start:4161 stop:6311 length:2151 start_codon:yes stop_codon:yes gene_type:complete
MAVTENLHTGDGSTNLFSFTFPYLAQTDIKVSLNGTDTTAYSLANATQITFNSVPQNNDAIRIYRDTADSGLIAEFFPGSAIRSSDLNNNFTQNLYVTQESDAEAARATTAANAATTAANTATTTANLALDNSRESDGQGGFNTAISVANSATTTANTASATANTASATATAAQTAVADAGFYTPIAALANLPTSPANQDRVEVTNSTGIESNSSVSTVPAGFVGSTNLTVRLQYNSSTSKWVFQQYFAADPESRYAAKSELATTVLELTDAVQAPSSTTISFAAGKYNNQNNLTGGDYFLDTNNTLDYFEFTWVAGNDSTVDTALGNIQVNDQVIINVPTGAPSNGNYTHVGSLYSVRESVTINSVSCYRIKVSFANSDNVTAATNFPNISTSILNITSPRITNGTVALADDSILRYDSTLTQWVARNNADTFAELTDFAYKPNNNTLTFASGSNDQNNPAFYVTGKYRTQGSVGATPWEFDWAIGNTLIDTQLLGLSAGDAVTIEWPTASSSNGSVSVSATVDTVAAYQTSSGYTHYSMKFAGALPSTPNIATSTLTFTSNSISGGTSAITNNQVLRYKTATSKWTVDSITEPDPDTALTDVAQTFTAAQRGTITTLTDGATVTPDFAASNNYTLTLGGNRTIANPTNLTAGQSGSIFLVQDGTGSRTAAWGSYWDFAGGTAPTLTTTASAVDRVDYVVRSSTSIHAVATLAYS